MSDLRIHHVSFSDDSISVAFCDKRSVAVLLSYFPRLRAAPPEQHEHWQHIERGLGYIGRSWDEDLSVENILSAYSRSKAGEYAHASYS